MKKKIDILCFNSIKAINGPVIIHRSILKFNDFFINRGYDVSIIFKEGIFKEEYISNDTIQNKSSYRKLSIKDYLLSCTKGLGMETRHESRTRAQDSR